MEKIIPGCCGLRGFAAKEFSLQGLDPRNVIQMTPALDETVAGADQFGGELCE